MHVDVVPNRKSRPAILVRESYREDGKVKKRTLPTSPAGIRRSSPDYECSSKEDTLPPPRSKTNSASSIGLIAYLIQLWWKQRSVVLTLAWFSIYGLLLLSFIVQPYL